MGMITYLQPVHGEEPAGVEVDIDKSAYELIEGLDALGLNGNVIVMGYLGSGEDPDDDNGAVSDTHLDPEQVQWNWQHLQAVTSERFLAAFKATNLGASFDDQDNDYFQAHFMTLRDVYRTAADAGAGIKITTC
ncbi:DUF1877 family protein [Actinomadura oligospora]|uniref:DUF1877 family protein n=1 Tax=Actinomadura oligospora TaxID=111804 RepID=UPI0004B597F8|nr:DUF1877 family protein [Actinomadura oligospora]